MQTNGIPEEEMTSTNIRVDTETRDRITKHGKYGDSINDILVRILNEYEKNLERKK